MLNRALFGAHVWEFSSWTRSSRLILKQFCRVIPRARKLPRVVSGTSQIDACFSWPTTRRPTRTSSSPLSTTSRPVGPSVKPSRISRFFVPDSAWHEAARRTVSTHAQYDETTIRSRGGTTGLCFRRLFTKGWAGHLASGADEYHESLRTAEAGL